MLLEPGDDPADELQKNCARLDELAPRLRDLLREKPIGACTMLGDLEQRIAAI